MADDILPIQPLTPSLPTSTPPEDKRKDKEKQRPNDEDSENKTDSDDEKKPHHGLFDEYV